MGICACCRNDSIYEWTADETMEKDLLFRLRSVEVEDEDNVLSFYPNMVKLEYAETSSKCCSMKQIVQKEYIMKSSLVGVKGTWVEGEQILTVSISEKLGDIREVPINMGAITNDELRLSDICTYVNAGMSAPAVQSVVHEFNHLAKINVIQTGVSESSSTFGGKSEVERPADGPLDQLQKFYDIAETRQAVAAKEKEQASMNGDVETSFE